MLFDFLLNINGALLVGQTTVLNFSSLNPKSYLPNNGRALFFTKFDLNAF
jgi:hypothetical protein